MTGHDFAAYLANRDGPEDSFLVGFPEKNPSPEDVQRVTDEKNKSGGCDRRTMSFQSATH